MTAKKTTTKKTAPLVIKEKTAQEFQKAYGALCREYGFQLNIVPIYRARDDGTWSTVLRVSVSKYNGTSS